MSTLARFGRGIAALLLAGNVAWATAATTRAGMLTEAVESSLGEKLETAGLRSWVFWTRLDNNAFPDALVVIKAKDAGDCFPDQGVLCQLLVFKGRADGFDRVYRSSLDEQGVFLGPPASRREFVHFYRPAEGSRQPFSVSTTDGPFKRSAAPVSKALFEQAGWKKLRLQSDFEELAGDAPAASGAPLGGRVVLRFGPPAYPAHSVLHTLVRQVVINNLLESLKKENKDVASQDQNKLNTFVNEQTSQTTEKLMAKAHQRWQQADGVLQAPLQRMTERVLLNRTITLSFQGCNDWTVDTRRKVSSSGLEHISLCYETLSAPVDEKFVPDVAAFYALGSLGPALLRFSDFPLDGLPDDEGFIPYLAGYLSLDPEAARRLATAAGAKQYRDHGEIFISVASDDKTENAIFRRDFAVRFGALACALRLRDRPGYDRMLSAADAYRFKDVFPNGEMREVALSHWARSTEKQCTESATWLKNRGIQ
jgi:hypothetical protein